MNRKYIFTLLLLTAMFAGCSKTYMVEDADASFIAHKLDGDKVRVSSDTKELTVQLFTKTINGIDQQVAFVEFEFTGTGDHTALWSGDSCSVYVPSEIDGATGDTLKWEYKKFASDYERFKDGDFTQEGHQLTNNTLVYTYWKAGTYKAFMVATNWGEMDSDEMKRDEKTIIITVTE